MEKSVKYANEALKRFGIRGIIRIVARISWFILPFAIWVQLYSYLGQTYYVAILLIPMVAFMVFYVVFLSLMFIQTTQLYKKLMEHISSAKRLFDNPQDIKSEKNFREECSKLIAPYLYYTHMSALVFAEFPRAFGVKGRAIIRFFQIFVTFYFGYLIIVIFENNQLFFKQFWNDVSPSIPYLTEANSVLAPFFQNPIPSTVLIFLISLLFTGVIPRRGYMSYSLFAWEIINDSFSLVGRIMYLATSLIELRWYIEKRSKTLEYAPFTFPNSLPLILQNSVMNIENRECRVTRWSYMVKGTGDINALKQVIIAQNDIPLLVKFFCANAQPEDALKKITEAKPVLCVGIIDDKCGIVCKIEFDAYERIFRGEFIFDNRHVKEEFESIARIEINKQKELKGQLPPNVMEIISKFGEAND
jgi:hypothetical protein